MPFPSYKSILQKVNSAIPTMLDIKGVIQMVLSRTSARSEQPIELTGDVTGTEVSGVIPTTLATTAVTPGSYTSTNLTVDSAGRITAAANGSGGSGTVTSITAGAGLTGGTITTSGTINIDSTVATLSGSQTLTNKSGLISQWTNDAGYLTSVVGFVPTSRTLTINGVTDDLSTNRSWTVGDALAANPLSQFAATTSSQLAGVISDEVGTGSLVFQSYVDSKRSFVRFENGSTTVAASQTYYGGSFASVGLSTTAALRRIYFTSACTITDVTMYIVVNGVGSNNSISYFIRKNNSSDTPLTSSSITSTSTVITTTGLSLSISAGDYIEIKTVTTTLASSHTGYFQSGTIGIQ